MSFLTLLNTFSIPSTIIISELQIVVNYDSDAGQWVNNIAKLFSGGKTSKGTQSFVDRILELSNTRDISKVDITGVADNITKKFGEIDESVLKAAETLKTKGAAGLDDFKKAAKNAGKGSAKFAASLKSIAANVGIMIALEVAVWAVSKAVDALVVTVEEQREKVEQLKGKYEELNTEYEQLIEKQKELGDNGLTQYEKDRLDYLERRLELEEKVLEIETRRLYQKETGNGAIWDRLIANYDSTTISSKTLSEFGTGYSGASDMSLAQAIYYGIKSNISGYEATLAETEELMNYVERLRERQQEFENNGNEVALDANQTELHDAEQKMLDQYDTLVTKEAEYLANYEELQEKIDSGLLSGDDLIDVTQKRDMWKSAYEAIQLQVDEVGKLMGLYDDFAALESEEFFDKSAIVDLINSGKSVDEVTEILNTNFPWLTQYMEENGITIEGLVEHYKELKDAQLEVAQSTSSIANVVSDLNSLSSELTNLGNILTSIKDSENINLSDLSSVADYFLGLEDVEFDSSAVNNAIHLLGEEGHSVEEQRAALNTLASTYIEVSGVLDNLTDENAELMKLQLERMGITNAEMVIEKQLGRELKNEAELEQILATKKKEITQETVNLTNVTATEIEQLISEGMITTEDAHALTYFALQKRFANGINLDTSTDIFELKLLLENLGATTTALDTYNKVKNGANGMPSYIIDQYKQQAEQEIQTALDLAKDSLDAEYDKFKVPVEFDGDGSTNSAAENAAQTFDWIETAISRIQRTITNLGNIVSATYKKWSTRNNALAQELGAVNQEIALQQAAYNAYMSQANAIGLSEEYKQLVQSGGLRIDSIADETLAEQIEKYKEYYEKALAAADAVEELRSQLAELARTKFDHIATQYDQQIGVIDHNISMMEGFINQAETAGYLAGEKYYESMIQYQQENIPTLTDKYHSLVAALNEAVSNGSIEYGSEEWENMRAEINDVELALLEANTALIEYNNSLRQLKWDVFDRIQDYISNITEESEFLIDLLDNEDLFDDFGNMTDRGRAVQGLHAVNYNTYMEQADRYAEEILRLNEEIAQDPNNLDLIDRRNELLELQRDAIINAEAEKEAIHDLIEEGYNVMLESLQELIDKRKEALQAEKDMYDYQNKVSEQTDAIAKYRKQLEAYAGDNSEEAKATIQQLKVSLEEAEKELQETEYDKWLSDQEQMLDDLYNQTEEWVNIRLDDINSLISDAIATTNESANQISGTLYDVTDSVGYTITDEMNNIWSAENIAIDGLTGVVSMYGDTLNGTMTSVKQTIDALNVNTVNLGEILKAGFVTSGSSSTPTVPDTNSGGGSSGNGGNNGSGNSGTPKNPTTPAKAPTYRVIDIDTNKVLYTCKTAALRTQWLKNNPSYSTVKTVGTDLYVREVKKPSALSGSTGGGGVKVNEAYASGTNNAVKGLNLVAEKGKEIIVNKDGSIVLANGAQLYPFKGGEKVYNNTETEKLLTSNITPLVTGNMFKNIDMSNLPATGNKTTGNVKNEIMMNISLPGVKNYDEFVSALKADRQFEKYVQAVTIDQALGKNSLSKHKF